MIIKCDFIAEGPNPPAYCSNNHHVKMFSDWKELIKPSKAFPQRARTTGCPSRHAQHPPNRTSKRTGKEQMICCFDFSTEGANRISRPVSNAHIISSENCILKQLPRKILIFQRDRFFPHHPIVRTRKISFQPFI